MNGSRFILQADRGKVAAADESTDPGPSIDGIEHGVVDIHLLLYVQADGAKIRIRAIENSPVETAARPIGDTTGSGGSRGWIGYRDDKRLADLVLNWEDILIE